MKVRYGLYHINILKDSTFKSFVRYVVSKASNEDSEYAVNRTRIAHALSSSRDTTVTEHDILIVASILYKVDLKLIEQLIESNYDSIDIDTKRVYNMYWQNISKSIKQNNNKLHKILKDADYLNTLGYVKM